VAEVQRLAAQASMWDSGYQSVEAYHLGAAARRVAGLVILVWPRHSREGTYSKPESTVLAEWETPVSPVRDKCPWSRITGFAVSRQGIADMSTQRKKPGAMPATHKERRHAYPENTSFFTRGLDERA
jgi:hypothetical protein